MIVFKPFTPQILILHQKQTAFEKIVEKGEIACNEQFLLFPQCFLLSQKIVSPFVHIFEITSLFAAEELKGLKYFNPLPHNHNFSCHTLLKKPPENIVGKGENAGNQYFFPFTHSVFYLIKESFHHVSHAKIVDCKCFQFGEG